MDALTRLLTELTPSVVEDVRWNDMQLCMTAYLSSRHLPRSLVSSIRAIVVREGGVLVVQDPIHRHVLPGGRREGSESFAETLQREILEESGWVIGRPRRLGFMHFRHRTPRPYGHPYSYPDFLQAVYVAQAQAYREDAREINGYELGAEFHNLSDVRQLDLPKHNRVFLEEAIRLLGLDNRA